MKSARSSSAESRLARLRTRNSAAADLAAACALAVRVEPDLLRRLRLLLPNADAGAEADLWFSDLVAARDTTAMTLDPVVADLLRSWLSSSEMAALRDAAWQQVSRSHTGSHWSVRLEERIRYLDAAKPPGGEEEIEELLLAALDRLAKETTTHGVARWLLGAVGRLPRQVARGAAARATATAAALHVDRHTDPTAQLSAGESHTWLPWLLSSLTRVDAPVTLLDGAVVLGADGPASVPVPGVPDTDPLVLEVRWHDGTAARSRRVRFRIGEPVTVETGARSATLVSLAGTAAELTLDDESVVQAGGLRFDDIKATLRPCLAREGELSLLGKALTDPSYDSGWVVVHGPAGHGCSTLLMAAADMVIAGGGAVIEHFFGRRSPATDDAGTVVRSCLAQLAARYPSFQPQQLDPETETGEPGSAARLDAALRALAGQGAFAKHPLVIALDGLGEDNAGSDAPRLRDLPFPSVLPAGVRYLVSATRFAAVRPYLHDFDRVLQINPDASSNMRVCHAMIERDRSELQGAWAGPFESTDAGTLTELGDGVPGRLADIIAWIRRQPRRSVVASAIPAVITVRWEQLRLEMARQFGDLVEIYLDIVRAADGVHTIADCAEAAAADPGAERWESFWDVCAREHLAAVTSPDSIVYLTEPLAGRLFAARARYGDRYLGVRGDKPAEFARTASKTRLAAAVRHALAVSDINSARALCTDLDVLRRRYVEDVAGLLSDVAATAEATRDGGLLTLQAAIQGLAKEGASSAAFATALHDRLAERGVVSLIPRFDDALEGLAALAPLRVGSVTDEDQLAFSTWVTKAPETGVLAIAPGATQTEESVAAGENALVLTSTGIRWIDFGPRSQTPERLVGARGGASGLVAWSQTSLYVDDAVALREPTPVLQMIGPCGAEPDFAVRITDAAVLASEDGRVEFVPLPGARWRRRQLVAHAGRVTAAAALPDRSSRMIVTAGIDGTIRLWTPPASLGATLAGHRGPVRCLAFVNNAALVSGGDDGCLILWELSSNQLARRQQAHDAPVTCVAILPDGTVVSGGADGTVAAWHPQTGGARTLGHHDEAVRGIATHEQVAVTWGSGVRFWEPRTTRVIAGHAAGFPGGVQGVVVGVQTYTALCGDGTVCRRLLPEAVAALSGGRWTGQRRDRACLAIAGDHVYTALGSTLLRLAPEEPVRPVTTAPDEITQIAVPLASDELIFRDSVGRVFRVRPAGGNPEPLTGTTYDLIATSRSGRPAIAAGSRLWTEIDLEAGGQQSAPHVDLPTTVTSLAIGGQGWVAAGLESGDAVVLPRQARPDDRHTLSGDGAALTAVALREDNSTITRSRNDITITGSRSGHVRWWPPDPSRGSVVFQRPGVVTAIVQDGRWVLTGGEDGRIVLWAAEPPQQVHEINLGAPVMALAAQAGRIVARDGHGRLWWLNLDTGTTPSAAIPQLLLSRASITSRSTMELAGEIRNEDLVPYEIRVVRINSGGRPLPVLSALGRPTNADGSLDIPTRPQPGEPWRAECEFHDAAEGESMTFTIEIELVSRAFASYVVAHRNIVTLAALTATRDDLAANWRPSPLPLSFVVPAAPS
jgi:WD40 repeat protein